MLTSPAGARFPPHRCRPRYQATQRGLPVPPGADTDIPLVGAGPGGPSKHATTPPIWGLPGALGASAPPQSTAARRPRVFYWGEARGLMPGGRGPQTPRHPSVIRLFSSAQHKVCDTNAVQIIPTATPLLMRASQSLAELNAALRTRRRAGWRPHRRKHTTLSCHQF